MKNEKKYNNFTIFLIAYGGLILITLVVIIGRILFDTPLPGPSSISSYNIEQIKRTNAVIQTRQKLDYPSKPRLQNYVFGKQDPFN